MTDLAATMQELGLTVEAEFVPYSRSRNYDPGAPVSKRSLNWRVTLKRDGRVILTTDYSAGIGHCPSYKQEGWGARMTIDRERAIEFETERGKPAWLFQGEPSAKPGSKPIMPDAADVVYSLAMDSDVLDSSSFEEWAPELGYDADSRKAEAIYRACLEIALKLRNGLGEDALAKLREAAAEH